MCVYQKGAYECEKFFDDMSSFTFIYVCGYNVGVVLVWNQPPYKEIHHHGMLTTINLQMTNPPKKHKQQHGCGTENKSSNTT